MVFSNPQIYFASKFFLIFIIQLIFIFLYNPNVIKIAYQFTIDTFSSILLFYHFYTQMPCFGISHGNDFLGAILRKVSFWIRRDWKIQLEMSVPFPFRARWLSNKRQSCLINQTTWVCLRNVFQEIQSRIKLGSQLVTASVSPHTLSLLSHRERTGLITNLASDPTWDKIFDDSGSH